MSDRVEKEIESKNDENFELVTLKSGVISLRSLNNLETFHPVTGPAIEAQILHVDQQCLVSRAAVTEQFTIWDVGLGAAANALTAIQSLIPIQRPIEIHSFDQTTGPLEFVLQNAKNFDYLVGQETLLTQLISNHKAQVTPFLSWYFHLGDFRKQLESLNVPSPHAILYDPYSPLSNPEMWTLEHFLSLYNKLDFNRPCLLTNYTRSTAVRVSLLLAGFYVGIGQEVGQKAETTVASNVLELLKNPLDRKWLERVQASRNSAPLGLTRVRGTVHQQISSDDLERLRSLRQFQ